MIVSPINLTSSIQGARVETHDLETEVTRLREENRELKEARRVRGKEFDQLALANRQLQMRLDTCRETIRDTTQRIAAVLTQARDGM
jgi:chromosome segregation ATPase